MQKTRGSFWACGFHNERTSGRIPSRVSARNTKPREAALSVAANKTRTTVGDKSDGRASCIDTIRNTWGLYPIFSDLFAWGKQADPRLTSKVFFWLEQQQQRKQRKKAESKTEAKPRPTTNQEQHPRFGQKRRAKRGRLDKRSNKPDDTGERFCA
jgi:hypothetical protein